MNYSNEHEHSYLGAGAGEDVAPLAPRMKSFKSFLQSNWKGRWSRECKWKCHCVTQGDSKGSGLLYLNHIKGKYMSGNKKPKLIYISTLLISSFLKSFFKIQQFVCMWMLLFFRHFKDWFHPNAKDSIQDGHYKSN